jgi:cyanate lyase
VIQARPLHSRGSHAARLGVDEVWLASLIHGQATASLAEADSLLETLAISETERQELREQLTT